MTAPDRIAILKAILAAAPGNTSAAQRARLLAAVRTDG